MEIQEEQENVEIDLEAIVASESEQDLQEDIHQEQDQPELSPIEQKAFDQGWRPLDEFSGPEENWKTAKEYVRDGEFISTIKKQDQKIEALKSEFDKRLENANKLHEAKRLQEIKDLKKQQRDAVNDMDTDAYDDAQKKIDNLESQTVEDVKPEPVADPVLNEWNERNPWFFDETDDRTPAAKGYFNSFTSKNPTATLEQALKFVDDKINTHFSTKPTPNPRREQANLTENISRPAKRQSKNLTMSDLTPTERKDYEMFGRDMFTEEEFLKTVKDTRAK